VTRAPSVSAAAVSIRLAWPALLLLLIPVAARAQVGASITLTSDARFRGHSVGRGEPAVTVDIAYDHPSGIYAGAAATAAIVEGEPRIVNVQADIGFVHRIDAGTSLDLGVVRSHYGEYSSSGHATHYTEVYAGVLVRQVAVYVRYSPDYFQPGVQTLYAEVDGVMEPAPDWRLTAHAGALTRIAGPAPPGASRTGYDWRVGAARRLGAFELQLALSGGGPMPEYYDGALHDRTAVTVSLVWSL
jgi:uncharacterized protein (TIGR02001 family)